MNKPLKEMECFFFDSESGFAVVASEDATICGYYEVIDFKGKRHAVVNSVDAGIDYIVELGYGYR